MYAILRQGSHQYRVSPGDVIQVEKLDVESGTQLDLDNVLLIGRGEDLEFGQPVVANAAVRAQVVRNGKSRKVLVFKYKRRKGYKKTYGHRQPFTELRITGILKDGQELASE